MLAVRNTVPSAGQATAVNALIWQGVRVDVLAVVSDGLPEPAEATYRFAAAGWPRPGHRAGPVRALAAGRRQPGRGGPAP